MLLALVFTVVLDCSLSLDAGNTFRGDGLIFMTTRYQELKAKISKNMDGLKSINDEEFEEIKRKLNDSPFDEEMRQLLIAMIEQKRAEFKTRN